MAFDKIKTSQPKVVQLLENSLKKDRLSHAYLFEGEAGTKKFDTALYFAQMLLCKSEEKPCLECSNCRRIRQGIHPNVYIVKPNNNSIRKGQIQDLQIEFSKTSIEPGKKIYIIKDIDTINVSAANSLLKFLEEPYSGIHGILTTNNINRLLPTIISRSQVVQFSSLNKNVLQEEIHEAGYDMDTARIVAQLTNSTEVGVEIASSDFFLDVLEAVKEIYNIVDTQKESVVIYFNQNHSIIYQDKEITKLFLACLILYQKDIIHYKTEDTYHIVFKNEIDTISGIANQKTKKRLIEELESMLSLQSRLNSYINMRLAYDNLLLELERR